MHGFSDMLHCCLSQICVLVYASSSYLKKCTAVFLLGAFTVAFVASALGYVPPYSVSDQSHPRPKRLILQVNCLVEHRNVWLL